MTPVASILVSLSLVLMGAPPDGSESCVETVRSLRLRGELVEAQDQAEAALASESLDPAIAVALHLELARILDRGGLHHNTRPVTQALDHVNAAAAIATERDLSATTDITLTRGYLSYRAEAAGREYPLARHHAEAARLEYHDAGDLHGEADAVHLLGLIHLQRREMDEAQTLFDRSLQLDDAGGSRAFFRGEYHRHVGMIRMMSDDPHGAIPHFERSLQYRKDAGAIDASLFAAESLGAALISADRADEAAEPLLYGLLVADNIDSPVGRARIGLTLGRMYMQLGDTVSARAAYELALDNARAVGLGSMTRRASEGLEVLSP